MKKSLLTLLFLGSIIQFASSQAYEGKIEYQKKTEPALVIDFPYPAGEVEDAIVNYLDKMGHKKKESKGFLQYKGVAIKEINPQPLDYLFRIERKSRKEKDESSVYLVMQLTEDNPLARASSANMGTNAKSFLNSLVPHVEAYHLEVAIKEQEDVIVAAEKKLKNMKEDKEDMDKKIKKLAEEIKGLEEDIKVNGKDQEAQLKVIEKQREMLEDLKRKRRSA